MYNRPSRHTVSTGEMIMARIEYIATDQQDLDRIAGLWEKQRQHHRAVAREFAAFFTRITFAQRKEGLLKIGRSGKLRLDIAFDTETARDVGYCITSLSAERKGEIESIYVEPDYRGQGIGDGLMRRALRFLDEEGTTRKVLGVAAGNEAVFGFYRRYGFVPRVTALEQIPDPS